MRVQKPKKIKRSALEKTRTVLGEKIRESAVSVLPILVIVVILCLCLIGALLLTVGMGLFSLGAEQSMTLIGSRIGTALTKTKNLPLILGVSFLLGFAITVAEPDLQVLAGTVPHIEKTVLLAVVGAGVGLFMSLCMVRILYGIRLRWVLLVCYAIVFALAAFTDKNFLSIAFDSGGVTTGPMTVPFILALGLGVSNIRSDSGAKADSFGLVALCSIGPILAVLILGLFYRDSSGVAELTEVSYASTTVIGSAFLGAIPVYLKEMAVAMLPIVGIFLIFQLAMFRMNRRSFWKIMVGILYTYVGLVLFLTGVNVGFSSLGAELGAALAEGDRSWLLIPLAALLGWFIISAEPAVGVLEKQIEDVSAGAIPGKTIKASLSVAIALAMAFSMLRVVTGISLLWFIVPGYALALILSFFVPDIYTAIAFDSGGVASGPMTATFMLQFMMGTSIALGGDVLCDAFGVVALVAMMPLLSIQAVGFYAGFAEDAFLPGETDVLGEVISLLSELWLSPATRGGLFLPAYVDSEREQLVERIERVKNDKRSWAFRRLRENMCAYEDYATGAYGTADEAGSIHYVKLTKHYKELLAVSPMEIFYCGSRPGKEVAAMLREAFALLPRGEIDLDLGTDIRMNAVEEKPRYFTEEDEISQGVLAVGFRLGECMDDPDPAKLAVFNAVYGAGVTSKLFQNVREKLSLCYYAFSSIDTLKGIMAVLSGIEVDKYDETLREILAQLDAVRAGDISEAELAAARRSVANDLRTGADSPYYLADFYLRETVQGTDATPDDIAALAENVTAEDVAAIARGVELDAVYFLRGEEAETE